MALALRPPIAPSSQGADSKQSVMGSSDVFRMQRKLEKKPSFNVTKEMLDTYKAAFQVFDKDGDGHITREELRRVLRSFGENMDEEGIIDVLKAMDRDCNGTVEIEEFVRTMVRMDTIADARTTQVDDLREAFKIFDKDGSGHISVDELREMMAVMGQDGQELGENELAAMLRAHDYDGDGRVGCNDFIKMMT